MDLDSFIRSIKFPTQEMLEDTLLKLRNESIVMDQVSSLTKDECEEIGLSMETYEILMNAVKVRVENFSLVNNKREFKQD